MSEYTVEGYRTPGHLAERLLTVFCWYTQRKKKESQGKKAPDNHLPENRSEDDVSSGEKNSSCFDTNNVAIAVAANDYFIPYCATFLEIDGRAYDSDKNYDILLLSQDVFRYQRKEKKMLSAWKNISLRVLDPSVLIDQYTFHIEGHFSKETYYRLVLPLELLPNYDKVLYLDSGYDRDG